MKQPFAKLSRVSDPKAITAEFTAADLRRLMAAIRLREEACRDNDETREANLWRRIYRKVAFVADWKE
jgi:hypothetical protein